MDKAKRISVSTAVEALKQAERLGGGEALHHLGEALYEIGWLIKEIGDPQAVKVLDVVRDFAEMHR